MPGIYVAFESELPTGRTTGGSVIGANIHLLDDIAAAMVHPNLTQFGNTSRAEVYDLLESAHEDATEEFQHSNDTSSLVIPPEEWFETQEVIPAVNRLIHYVLVSRTFSGLWAEYARVASE
jgi:hypothetical protein